jgi:uncharacterized coiled-coil DUF342 family protein
MEKPMADESSIRKQSRDAWRLGKPIVHVVLSEGDEALLDRVQEAQKLRTRSDTIRFLIREAKARIAPDYQDLQGQIKDMWRFLQLQSDHLNQMDKWMHEGALESSKRSLELANDLSAIRRGIGELTKAVDGRKPR